MSASFSHDAAVSPTNDLGVINRNVELSSPFITDGLRNKPTHQLIDAVAMFITPLDHLQSSARLESKPCLEVLAS